MADKSVTIISYGDPTKGAQASIEAANLELVIKVAATAKSLCPVDEGLLRNSIMWKTPKQSGLPAEGKAFSAEPGKGDGIVGSATEYAAYVEFGTRRQRAQPYLRPAVAIEVLGPNGAKTMSQESVIEMTKALNKGRKVYNG